MKTWRYRTGVVLKGNVSRHRHEARSAGLVLVALSLCFCSRVAPFAVGQENGVPTTNSVPRAVQVNPVSASHQTNQAPPRIRWEGWDGLHYDLSRRAFVPFLPEMVTPPATDSN